MQMLPDLRCARRKVVVRQSRGFDAVRPRLEVHDPIPTSGDDERVGSGLPEERVAFEPAEEPVVTGAAREHVDARAAVHVVIPRPAVETVGTRAAVQQVLAAAAREEVGAVAAHDGVVAALGPDAVIAPVAANLVVPLTLEHDLNRPEFPGNSNRRVFGRKGRRNTSTRSPPRKSGTRQCVWC